MEPQRVTKSRQWGISVEPWEGYFSPAAWAFSGSEEPSFEHRCALVQVPGSTSFGKALGDSWAKFNELPEKVQEGFGAEVQPASGEGSGKGSGRSWCGQVQRGFK